MRSANCRCGNRRPRSVYPHRAPATGTEIFRRLLKNALRALLAGPRGSATAFDSAVALSKPRPSGSGEERFFQNRDRQEAERNVFFRTATVRKRRGTFLSEPRPSGSGEERFFQNRDRQEAERNVFFRTATVRKRRETLFSKPRPSGSGEERFFQNRDRQ